MLACKPELGKLEHTQLVLDKPEHTLVQVLGMREHKLLELVLGS